MLSDGAQVVDLGDVAVLPGLVNAHTHLELSYLRDEVPPASQFVTWIRGVMKARRQRPDPSSSEILDAVDSALKEAVACGTAIVGDISNTLVTFGPAHAQPPRGRRLLRADPVQHARPGGRRREGACGELEALVPTERVRASLAAHAPYSVAPLVLRAIRQAVDRDPFAPCSIHLSESVEEVEFIRTGGGPVARAARGDRLVGSRLGAAGRHAGAVSRRQRLSRRPRARGPRRADDDGRSRSAGGARHDARHLSAQQRPHRRRSAADRGLLQLRREGRGRHRQPRQRAGSQRLRRAGDDAGAGADGVGVARCSTARRGRARARSASTPTTARSSRASPRGCSPSACRRTPTMWKNTW